MERGVGVDFLGRRPTPLASAGRSVGACLPNSNPGTGESRMPTPGSTHKYRRADNGCQGKGWGAAPRERGPFAAGAVPRVQGNLLGSIWILADCPKPIRPEQFGCLHQRKNQGDNTRILR